MENQEYQIKLQTSMYHNCSIDTLKKILSSKKLWVCDIYKMNDSTETELCKKAIEELFSEKYIGYKDIYNDYERLVNQCKPYIACFAKSINNEVATRYGEAGKGVIIEFDNSQLNIGINIYGDYDFTFIDVLYDKDKCKNLIDLLLQVEINKGKTSVANMLLSQMCRFKEPNKWQVEEEVRLIFIPSVRNDLKEKYSETLKKNYYEVPLDYLFKKNYIKDIILGPDFDEDNIDYIENTLKDNGFGDVPIYKFDSKIKLNSMLKRKEEIEGKISSYKFYYEQSLELYNIKSKTPGFEKFIESTFIKSPEFYKKLLSESEKEYIDMQSKINDWYLKNKRF